MCPGSARTRCRCFAARLAGFGVRVCRIIPRLTDPARFGGDPRDAFTVIAPSLAGLRAFVPARPETIWRPRNGGLCRRADARCSRLFAFCRARRRLGGGRHQPVGLRPCGENDRIHLNLWSAAGREASAFSKSDRGGETLSRRAGALDARGNRLSVDSGYSSADACLCVDGFAAGLAAWIVEKFRAWSDCDGDVERAISRDRMLAESRSTGLLARSVVILALLRTVSRLRHSAARRGHRGSHGLRAISARNPQAPAQRDRARDTNIRRWTVMEKGGHFAALEQPECWPRGARLLPRIALKS